MSLDTLSLAALAFVAAAFLLAGFTHGALGFGFPIIATPLVALVIDVKSAIVLVAPVTLAVTVLSVVRGGGWRESVRRFWFVPLGQGAGSYIGTRLLIGANPTPFLLVLALIIFFYLSLEWLRAGESALVKRHAAAFGIGFGLVGGMFEATANVSVPPLLIYFMLLGLSPLPTVQVLNLCFSVGKAAQVGTWALFGAVPAQLWLASAAFALPSVAALWRGMAVRALIDAPTYRRALRGALWVMAGLLVAQFVRLEWLAAR